MIIAIIKHRFAKHVLTKVMVPMLIVKQGRMKRTAKSSKD